MKWLTNILAIYLLGLSLWPCADESLPITEQVDNAVFMATATSVPGSSHHHHDQCSPFCSCSCCSATISNTPRFSYSIFPSIEFTPVLETAIPYVTLSWADPLSTIWQPPKLRV